GRYRDVIRRFVRGDPGLVGEAASCIAGSSNLYADEDRLPCHSINFITCHDGFTLYDLVSYNGKHNEANGEDNRDGSDNNLSWNCGAEGETDNIEILALRQRQAKNLMSILFLSQGVPMILSGDEILHTQRGNNNTWCQDNELSWFDWSLVEKNADMLRFMKELIAFRRRHPNLNRDEFLTGGPVSGRGLRDIAWHGYRLDEPLWFDYGAQYLAFTLAGLTDEEDDVHVILNMSERTIEAPLPQISGRKWYLALDTSLTGPDDILPRDRQKAFEGSSYPIPRRTVAVFEARG
ncbi:MAG: glycogen debranching enzyme, partial [Gammaproteobacteria bacterium]